MPAPSLTLFVNTCDGFADMWPACFKLLRLNASGLDYEKTVLVTEKLEFAYEGFDIACSRANRDDDRRRTWSECLLDALGLVETDLIFYTQDDYFFDPPLDAAYVNALARRMQDDPSISHIGLTPFGSHGPYEKTDDPRLVKVGPRANYRITTQAGLWRVDALRSYVRADENVWGFEIYGTRRAWRREDLFLTADPGKPPIVDYIMTGIMKGQWHRDVPALFARYDIPMDFERRGFYDEPSTLVRRWRTFRTMLKSPANALNGLRGR